MPERGAGADLIPEVIVIHVEEYAEVAEHFVEHELELGHDEAIEVAEVHEIVVGECEVAGGADELGPGLLWHLLGGILV